jgi:hypothetical protein
MLVCAVIAQGALLYYSPPAWWRAAALELGRKSPASVPVRERPLEFARNKTDVIIEDTIQPGAKHEYVITAKANQKLRSRKKITCAFTGHDYLIRG